MLFLQSIVCRSAVHCLKSQRAALLLQDTRREGTFACTHTSIVACTSPICLLYWLCTCVNFILNSEGSVALFLSVVCHTLFLQSIVCSRSAVHCLKSRRAALLLQDTWWEGNRNLSTSGFDSGSSWLDGVNGILMQQEPNSPKQDNWNRRAIASLANTLITVVEPVPMPLLSSMLLLQL
jgi:hypothetical protein